MIQARPTAPAPPAQSDPIPVTPLGVQNNMFRFRAAAGDERALSSYALFDKTTLVALFGGEGWLRRHFPGDYVTVAVRAGGGRRVPTGFDIRAAAQDLAQRCVDVEVDRIEAAKGSLLMDLWSGAVAAIERFAFRWRDLARSI